MTEPTEPADPALYVLGEWAARYDPALLGLTAQDVGVLNDDRVGRAWRRCSTPTGPVC